MHKEKPHFYLTSAEHHRHNRRQHMQSREELSEDEQFKILRYHLDNTIGRLRTGVGLLEQTWRLRYPLF
ncbi:uncharacterized protein LY89DRAFT_418813 [Mollisia scopiformis]|uniref:Uncharacterized protein n=1 Tax=Mollisia scopiformis TaxID=149040 RepID=A0A194XL55_MOLSC|nr:uncharacterized protein LY89DRAFT_418813 [Mollisia scopiformis]KUJ20908.1 hypothetical protein LY89DRAFT_418813 [Mollisia scopiformis]